MTASALDALVILETVCQDRHFGIGEYSGVDSALVRHCMVTVLALRLMGNVEFMLAEFTNSQRHKCVVFAISQFH